MTAGEEAELKQTDRSPGTIKHLEFIQAVIGRLGNNGFLIKGWAITVAGLFFGFAVNSTDWRLGVASVMPILLFWGIDAYFLWAERRFRSLYALVARGDGRVPPFYMAATSDDFESFFEGETSSYFKTLILRPELWAFYGALLVSAAVIVLFVAFAAGTDPSKPTGEVPHPTVDATSTSLDRLSATRPADMSS